MSEFYKSSQVGYDDQYIHTTLSFRSCLSEREREMERLYDSAARGDVRALHELLGQEPFLLERVSYTSPNNTPLHVATMKGHLPFIKEILNTNSHLAEELNSQQSSPLHVASARGHVEIAKCLFDFAPDMCLSRDSQGRNPIHLAAIKGRVDVLEELVPRAPLAARETTEQGLTVLHLCVKYGQLEALKFLVREMKELIDEKNDDGDSILHMALKGKKHEIKKHLLQHTNINVNAKNSKGETAKAIFNQSQPNSRFQTFCKSKKTRQQYSADPQPEKWLTKKRDSIMVVAVLIATMAFQAGLTPVGGVWQNDFTKYPNGTLVDKSLSYHAGEAVMALKHPQYYKNFTRFNTMAFVSSLSTIMLLISGLPFRRPVFMWVLLVIMWLTVTAVAVTFAISINAVTPSNYKEEKSLFDVLIISLYVWCGVMGLLFFGNMARLIGRALKNCGSVCCTPKWYRDPVEVSHDRNGGHHHEESV